MRVNAINKAFAISDANIMFVSLVDKAANKRQFLITKADDGKAYFRTYGKILKTDAHYITGIVYEPNVEDTHGNYMDEEEIIKAAYSYAKNGMNADIQHNFKPAEGVTVVESYVTKCDEVINGEKISKGTWVMTMEVSNDEIFDAVVKGDLTGFSMGGVGQYSTEDVSLESDPTPVEKGGVLKWVAKKLGFASVAKGEVKDNYYNRITSEAFWQAFYALQDTLFKWNYYSDRGEYNADPEAIREALSEFNEIVTDILTKPSEYGNVTKSVEGIMKAGKAISSANKDTLKGIHQSLGEFLSKFDEEEDAEMTKKEVEDIVKSAIAECMGGAPAEPDDHETESITKADVIAIAKEAVASAVGTTAQTKTAHEPITKADVQSMINEAIKKAIDGDDDADEGTGDPTEGIEDVITKAIVSAMDPFMKQAGLPTNLNNNKDVKKCGEEEHYLHGLI